MTSSPSSSTPNWAGRGTHPKPVWAVTFWIVAKDGEDGFERRTAVEVHADTGEVLKIHSDP